MVPHELRHHGHCIKKKNIVKEGVNGPAKKEARG